MERPLDPSLLEIALGEHDRLPSRDEFMEALEDAEFGILTGDGEVSEEVGTTAWLLHAIASSREATELYGTERQLAAFRVSAHAFDLMLQRGEYERLDRARLCFAAQVAFLRSRLDPNSTAVYKRELQDTLISTKSILNNPNEYSLSCACALLAFDVDYVLNQTEGIYDRLTETARQLGVDSIAESPFGSAGFLAAGCRRLLVFLLYGNTDALAEAQDWLHQAVHPRGGQGDRIPRWAAAHLLNMAEGLASASIWNALPPDVPIEVRRAFTLARPKILTLWPPQLELIETEEVDGIQSPFSVQNDRQLITMPTSSGKTLFSHLIISAELHRSDSGVCYVAPTRSLCREVRQDLNQRLKYVAGLGARHSRRWMDSESTFASNAEVEVMTPERLSFLLREDATKVLDRFGLFVFDEVHNVGRGERGWTLEQDLAFLHQSTKDSHHRIILMSAAVGNRPHFVSWMGGKTHVYHPHTKWRATRRMHAVYTTTPLWKNKRIEQRRSKSHPVREIVPLTGELYARGSTGRHRLLKYQDSVGRLSLKVSKDGRDKRRESNHSSSNYKTVIPVVNHLATLGPVLVVQSTRQLVRLTAEAIAETRSVEQISEELGQMIDLVQNRLGESHPLNEVLKQRVAYHHGSLPSEIRHRIEDAVSSSSIDVIVATTTMTEGINLPVRSVVIASQGSYGADGYSEYIVGSSLLNAIGRAGRAAKETEGIVVLAKFRETSFADLDQLDPSPESLEANSWLTQQESLDQLARFETTAREAEEVVLQSRDGVVASFISFIWFVAAELDRLQLPKTVEEIEEWMQSTLAWVQLEEQDRQRWLAIAETALTQFIQTDEEKRRRWARSGVSIGTSILLDDLAQELAEAFTKRSKSLDSWLDLVLFVLGEERLSRLLKVSNTDALTIRTQQRFGTVIELDRMELVKDWVRGVRLGEIASKYLGDVTDTDYRFRQLGDLVYEVFEVHLPWLLRILANWTNDRLGLRQDPRLTEIPSLLRWGVPNPESAELMSRGISSRQFAIKVVDRWAEDESELNVLSWVRRLRRSSWIDIFGPDPSDLRSLVSIIRPNSKDTLLPFLRGDTIQIPFHQGNDASVGASDPRFEYPSHEWDEVYILSDETRVGRVKESHLQDVRDILEMGVHFEMELAMEDDEAVARLTLTQLD